MSFEKDVNVGDVGGAPVAGVDGKMDPRGEFPRKKNVNASSVNNKARGTERVHVELGGGCDGIDLELKSEPVSTYPNAQVKETSSGHIIETDDTPGAERIMIRHKSGSGVEMRSDGTMIYGSVGNTIRVSAQDEKVIVDGEGELCYLGNLKLKVAGDFDLEVGGDFNVRVDGDVDQTVKRGYKQDIGGTKEVQIIGGISNTIGEDVVTTIHGNNTDIIKGSNGLFIGGSMDHNVHGTLMMTAEKEVTLSTKRINMSSSKLGLLADSGTIGGTDIVYYGKTAHIPRVNSTSMHATTFHGDLTGTAEKANEANKAGTAAIGPAGSGGTPTVTTATNKTTVEPTTAILSDALEKSSVAIKRVAIDTFGGLFNRLNRYMHYGGLSTTDLNTEQVRSILRDPNNVNNAQFISSNIADGVLSPHYSRQTIAATGRVVGAKKSPRLGTTPIGRSSNPSKRYIIGNKSSVPTDFYVDAKFNPLFQDEITSRTKLAPGITMAKFLGGVGDPVTLTHILDDKVRMRLACQYVLHASAMKTINGGVATKEFKDYRLQVVEGLYRPEDSEKLDVTDGINYLMSRGRAVVYELINMSGEIAIEKTFNLAVYWKDNLQFEKLILDYDNYNPDDSLNAQIILVMPEITPPWTVRYDNNVETRYNNISQSTNELIEALRTT